MRDRSSAHSAGRVRRLAAGSMAAALTLGLVTGSARDAGAAPSRAVEHSTGPSTGSVGKAPSLLGPMLFIGDSVGASVKSSLTRLLTAGNYANTVDAVSGRCTLRTTNRCARGDAWSVLNNLDASFKPTFAVIELGYNDTKAALRTGIDSLMRDLLARGVKLVLWINLSERRPTSSGGSVYGPSNDVLAAAAKKWSELRILDWSSASAAGSASSWFVQGSSSRPDLIHLTSSGRKQFAQWIRDELDRLRDKGVLPGSEPATEEPKDNTNTTETTATSSTPAKDRPELRLGAEGQFVVDLQKVLKAKGLNKRLRADGDFGPATEKAVKAFQKQAGLAVDGRVGPKTWKALGF